MSKQKIVIKLGVPDANKRSKAMQLAPKFAGVNSVAITGDAKDRLEVIGEGVDAVCLVNCLRKKVCSADILVVEEVKDKKEKEDKKKKEEEEKKKKAEEAKKAVEEELRKLCTYPPPCTSYYGRPLPMVFSEDQPGASCHIL